MTISIRFGADAPLLTGRRSFLLASASSLALAACGGGSSGGGSTNLTATVTTLAGSGAAGSSDGTGSAATFFQTVGIAVAPSGDVYVCDNGNNLIRKITSVGVVTTFAGAGGSGGSFQGPTGVAVDGSGNVFVADAGSNLIRKITPGGVVSTFAGTGAAGSADGTALTATFNNPTGVAVDPAGNVYVADRVNNLIRKITAAGAVSTLAGSGAAGASDGVGVAATFNYPQGLAVDASGNVFVADGYNHKIRKISPLGAVSTLAGTGSAGSTDGDGAVARFDTPYTVTVSSDGSVVYVGDTSNHTVRKITSAGLVSTIAGSALSLGDVDGVGSVARFHFTEGIALDASGNLFVSDFGNNKIRKITFS
jgi:sugar lactone lactonase YvrE